MTVSMFVTLLTAFAAITGLCVEGVKKILDEIGKTYISNLLACIVGGIVGIGGTAAYYAIAGIAFTGVNIICMVLMGVSTAVGAMVGYDKLIQTIQQFRTKKTTK